MPPRRTVLPRTPATPPPIRLTLRSIANLQHRSPSGLTSSFATLPKNPPLTLILATLPKTRSRNPFVCHTCESPPGALPFAWPRHSFTPSFEGPLTTHHSPLLLGMRSHEKSGGEGAPVKRIPHPLHYLSVKSRYPRDSLPRGIHPGPLVPQQAHPGPP